MTGACLEIPVDEARVLTDRIKVGVDAVWELIKQAYQSKAWSALGYSSWDDYCTREFGTSRIRLPREERQEVVASMREIGMSVRAISSATGDSYGTVRSELAAREQNCSPDPAPVTGMDGKTYTRKPRAPKAECGMCSKPYPESSLSENEDGTKKLCDKCLERDESLRREKPWRYKTDSPDEQQQANWEDSFGRFKLIVTKSAKGLKGPRREEMINFLEDVLKNLKEGQ